jgi:hypothetical protein
MALRPGCAHHLGGPGVSLAPELPTKSRGSLQERDRLGEPPQAIMVLGWLEGVWWPVVHILPVSYHQVWRMISVVGTFETCRRTLKMSANRGRSEVIGAQSNRRD